VGEASLVIGLGIYCLESCIDSFWHHPQAQGPTTTVKVSEKL